MVLKFVSMQVLCLIAFSNFAFSYVELCVVGDTGTGKSEQYEVAEAMYKAGCKTIIHTGDVIYERGVQSETDHQWKTKFEDPFAPLINSGADFYISMGNHDYNPGKSELIQKIHTAYARNNDFYKFPDLYYDFNLGDACFWAVDSNRFTVPQADYIAQSMATKPGCQWKIAFGHHPIISSGHHGSAKPRSHLKTRLHPTLAVHADIYLSGHDHNLADEGYVEDTSYRQIISGAGAKLRPVASCKKTGCVYAESKLGFVKAYIKKENIILDFLDVNLNTLHSLTLNKE